MNPIKQFREFYLADARRYLDDIQFDKLLKRGHYARYKISSIEPGLKFLYWMRLCSAIRGEKIWLPLYLLALNRYNHYKYKYGISIPFITNIGKGFYIGHFGTIVINPSTIIGCNVNISQGVTIGATNRGEHAGVATIGDSVYIGPGAKIIGAIRIGNNVAIGANAVVTHDVPDNAVVAGVPARIISMNGANGYVNRKYEKKYIQ